MVSDAFLADFRRFMASGQPLPSPRQQRGPAGAYDSALDPEGTNKGEWFGSLREQGALDDEDETPPDRIEKWLTFLARRLSPEHWAQLQEGLKKPHFDAADESFAPRSSNLPAGAAKAMDSAIAHRRGLPATRSFLRRFPDAANIRTN